MKDVIISNNNLEKIKQNIKQQGKNKLHVLADFDRTLTKAFDGGKIISTSWGQVRQGGYLGEDYVKQAHKLFDQYHPIEINPNISKKEKSKKMYEWWKKHFELLIKKGINIGIIKDLIKRDKLVLRNGALEFIDFLYKNNIPLVIMSAGLGDVIKELLKSKKRLYKNIYIISNFFKFNKQGKATKTQKIFIHSMNKTEIAVKNYPKIFKIIKNKTNVILLGDNTDDVDMIEGFDYKNLIKIGFLNENPEENLPIFKRAYDIILLNDTNMDYINKLLKEII